MPVSTYKTVSLYNYQRMTGKGVARDELAIGCDFGMTYSSAAFLKPRKGTSVSVDIRDVSTIKEYSLKAMHEEEGPSTVCYISPHDLGNQRYFEAYNLRGADQNPPEFMVLYGHEVVHQYRNPNSGGYQKSSRDIRIDNFKILLDTRKTTKVLPGQQEELQNVENKIRLTIDRGCITNRLDPLRHFLKRWLCDVLKYLDRSHNVNKTTSKICFAVPSGWPSDTGRTLIKCVADALRHAKIGDEGTIAGLSFLNENLLAAVTCIRLLENFDVRLPMFILCFRRKLTVFHRTATQC
jgi:hypothetical protein